MVTKSSAVLASVYRARIVRVRRVARGRRCFEIEARRVDEERSLVLAPAGTAMFSVTQAGWATATGMSHTAERNAPVRTVNELSIFCSRMRRV
jgi:hypothetical protein